MGSTCRLREPQQMAPVTLMATQHQKPQAPPCSSYPAAPDPPGQLKYIPGSFPGDQFRSEVINEKLTYSSVPWDLGSCHAV